MELYNYIGFTLKTKKWQVAGRAAVLLAPQNLHSTPHTDTCKAAASSEGCTADATLQACIRNTSAVKAIYNNL